ncbi:SMI1/KNR4 family protein [Mucilaginibacter flavus]|uniref:SMI1/KNR4 family protein n=1 Tax=Mucilaginibacter flavus TaxID=931504 RepID=UPI0025B2984C|nr:SMI1/KNR4 family protein [Mucilaginibacter flavus]MDN3580029.1 SMI1/KNR4 family protein [Mucilaginibacter flavus]
MESNLIRKIKSVGGIEKTLSCTNDKIQIEEGFLSIERMFNSCLPQSYKDFYTKVGSFSFLEPVCIKCIDAESFMLKDNKVSVGNFYCISGNDELSTNKVLLTFQEQLPIGVLPIFEGELGDLICISLRRDDFESIYYFNHESAPGRDLFLITKGFENFIMGLEIYNDENDDLVKKMKVDYSPELIELLKKSGYGPKE